MVKITLRGLFFVRLTFLAIIFLITPSCSSLHAVSIKNSTTETIQFRGEFEVKPHPPHNLDFTLQPGAGDSWMYEISFFERKILDEGLKKIILTTDKGCKIILEREILEKIAVKDGAWKINIDQDMMACN
ncbi:MAG: hypothetical protein GXP14_17160 [Gammaproteobacteria bacterium]|nr:hypothetical protein [Gammaproteobacteria bacterium]